MDLNIPRLDTNYIDIKDTTYMWRGAQGRLKHRCILKGDFVSSFWKKIMVLCNVRYVSTNTENSKIIIDNIANGDNNCSVSSNINGLNYKKKNFRKRTNVLKHCKLNCGYRWCKAKPRMPSKVFVSHKRYLIQGDNLDTSCANIDFGNWYDYVCVTKSLCHFPFG